MTNRDIGDGIKKFRELKNVTREQIASKLNMSLSNYSKIERGEIDLTLTRVKRISEILEIDISQILNFDASQIFKGVNGKNEQGNSTKPDNTSFFSDVYKEKYIKVLEEENKRLKKIVEKK